MKKQSSLFRYSWIATHPADARNDTIYKDIKHTALSCHPLRTCGTVKTVHYGVTQYKKGLFLTASYVYCAIVSYRELEYAERRVYHKQEYSLKA